MSKIKLELGCAIMHDFMFRDGRVLFCLLPNPIEDLLFTILIEGDTLSSVSGMVPPVHEGQLDTGSWTIECPRRTLMKTGIS
jgi:hypothetical protein